MKDNKIKCIFRDKIKEIDFINDYNGFTMEIAKEFNLEKKMKDLNFFVKEKNEKIIVDKKYFKKNFVNNKINVVYCEYNPKINEITPNEENQLLNQKLSNLEEKMKELENISIIIKKKCQKAENDIILFEEQFDNYKKETQNIISELRDKILTLDGNNIKYHDSNIISDSKILKYSNEFPKPIKRGIRTPIDNDDEIFDNEKPINRKKTPMNENDFNQNNSIKNSLQNSNIQISKMKNSNMNNEDNDYNDTSSITYINSNNNYLQNKNMSNDNYSNNNLELNKKSKIITPNEIKQLSCEFIIDSRIPSKLKSSIIKNQKIKVSFQLKNNGKFPIPKDSILKYDKNDSDLKILDTYINDRKELRPNEIIQIQIEAYFQNNINDLISKIYKLKFFLFNKAYGKIGNYGLIQVQVLDENQNIINIYQNNMYNNKNELNLYEQKNQEIYSFENNYSNNNEYE